MAFSFENLKANLSQVAKKTGEVAEKAVKKGGEFAEIAYKKGGEVAELAKLNLSLKEKENELKKLFTELGMLTYDKAEAAEIAAKIVDIDDLKAAIEGLKSDIAAANGKTVCKCGKEIEINASFCPFCGAKVEEPVKAEPETEEKVEESAAAEEGSKPAASSDADAFVDTFENVVKKYEL